MAVAARTLESASVVSPATVTGESGQPEPLLGAPPGIGRRLRPPATQPVCGAPPSFVGRKDLPLQRVALTFTERDAMRAGRPDAARQSRVVSGPQFSPLTKEIQTEA